MLGGKSFSRDELKKIGIRFHSARALTGLKQDEFAKSHHLSSLCIKNWESGLALPKHEVIVAAINALKESGVFASGEWLLFGVGNGPNYYQSHKLEQHRAKDDLINEQIALFKNAQRAKGLEPVVVAVKDDSMKPHYRKGDFLGGILVSHEWVKSSANANQRPWLISCLGETFFPGFADCRGDRWFTFSTQNSQPKEISLPSFARIKWHYEVDEQP